MDGKALHLAGGDVGSSSSALGRGAVFHIGDGISEKFAIIVIAKLIVDEVFAQPARLLVGKVVSNRRLGVEQVPIVIAGLGIRSRKILMGRNATKEAAPHCRRRRIVGGESIANARLRTRTRRKRVNDTGSGAWAGQGTGAGRHSNRG